MPRQRVQLQFHILELLADATGPEGSGLLLRGTRARGVDASQATLGRALKVLDERGLTLRVGNKGRTITPEGRRWLSETRRLQGVRRWTEETLTAVGQSTLSELRASMVARRALEGEIARLAAENAPPAEVVELRRIVEEQGHDLETGGRGAGQAVDFHLALARVCGNQFLEAAASLVRTSSAALQTLMYHLGATIGSSYDRHIEVVEAIADRNPAGAAGAMILHLNELITDIDLWLARLNESAQRQPGTSSAGGHSTANQSRLGGGRTGQPSAMEPMQSLAGTSTPVPEEKEGRHNG